MSFEALLKEIEGISALSKSLPTDELVIPAGGAVLEKPIAEEEGLVLGKSFAVTDEAGVKHDAVDGTELVKSLIGRLDEQETKATDREEILIKSLTLLAGIQKDQAEVIKSLRTDLATFGSQGRGRNSVVSVSEKPGSVLQKSAPEGVDLNEFMAKAMDAQKAGRITGMDVAIAESSLNKGLAVPEGIVRRVLV